jgi:hypothetical protein
MAGKPQAGSNRDLAVRYLRELPSDALVTSVDLVLLFSVQVNSLVNTLVRKGILVYESTVYKKQVNSHGVTSLKVYTVDKERIDNPIKYKRRRPERDPIEFYGSQPHPLDSWLR